jgi:hypothetical protein
VELTGECLARLFKIICSLKGNGGKIMKKTFVMLFAALFVGTGSFCFGGLSSGTTLLSTSFDSNEGWTEGLVTVAPNPAVGSWYSYYYATSSALPCKVDLSGNGMDFSDPNNAMPSSGDGLLYSNRVGVTWAASNTDSSVSGWADNEGGPIVEVTVDMWMYKGSAVVALKNSKTDITPGVCLAAIIVSGGDVGYLDAFGVWTYPESGWHKAPIGRWDTVRLVADTLAQTYSVYIGETAIIENVPFPHTSGDGVVRSVMFNLGGPNSRAFWDNLRVAGRYNRPQFCGDNNTVYLSADINKDCKVDFKDFASLALTWTECTDPQNPACAAWIHP